MDHNLRRRAARNFSRLLASLASLVFFAAVALALVLNWAGWFSGRPRDMILVPVLAAMPALCLLAVVQQARRIAAFIPLRDAAAIWWAGLKRRVKGRRPLKAGAANLAPLAIVFVCVPPMLYLAAPLPPFFRPGNPWPLLGAYVLIFLLLLPLAWRGMAPRPARRWRAPAAAAMVALLPAALLAQIAVHRAEAEAFVSGPVHRETVLARIGGRCRPEAIGRGRRLLCADAATSRGPIRRWQIRLDRRGYDLQRRVGAVCLRIPLEWAADGAVRIAGGARRYRAEELISCPAAA